MVYIWHTVIDLETYKLCKNQYNMKIEKMLSSHKYDHNTEKTYLKILPYHKMGILR